MTGRAHSGAHKALLVQTILRLWGLPGWSAQRFGQLISNASYSDRGSDAFLRLHEDKDLVLSVMTYCHAPIEMREEFERLWDEIGEE